MNSLRTQFRIELRHTSFLMLRILFRYKRRGHSWLSVFHCFTVKHGHAFKQSTSTSRFAETALSWFYRTLCSRLCSMFPPKRSPQGHGHTQRKCRAVITDAQSYRYKRHEEACRLTSPQMKQIIHAHAYREMHKKWTTRDKLSW